MKAFKLAAAAAAIALSHGAMAQNSANGLGTASLSYAFSPLPNRPQNLPPANVRPVLGVVPIKDYDGSLISKQNLTVSIFVNGPNGIGGDVDKQGNFAGSDLKLNVGWSVNPSLGTASGTIPSTGRQLAILSVSGGAGVDGYNMAEPSMGFGSAETYRLVEVAPMTRAVFTLKQHVASAVNDVDGSYTSCGGYSEFKGSASSSVAVSEYNSGGFYKQVSQASGASQNTTVPASSSEDSSDKQLVYDNTTLQSKVIAVSAVVRAHGTTYSECVSSNVGALAAPATKKAMGSNGQAAKKGIELLKKIQRQEKASLAN